MKKARGLFFVVFYYTLIASNEGVPPGYFAWQDPKSNRTGLFCPMSCKHKNCDSLSTLADIEDVTSYCRCRASPLWTIDGDAIENDFIEYTNRFGRALVISLEHIANQMPQNLVHMDGFLRQLPENICSFQNLVKVDFTNNRLCEIRGINCLTDLDTLILKGNRIETVHNDTFVGMSNLRVLDLSLNGVTRLEPQTLSHSTLGLYVADFSHNALKTIDITNLVIKQPFCEIKYNDNHIEELTNNLPFHFDLDISFGDGGFMNLQNNDFKQFPDFTKLGISDLTQLGKVFNFGFDFRGCKFTCDCVMVPFLELSKEVVKKIWRDYFDVECFQPPELANQSIANLTVNGQLDGFICNISKSENCPGSCHCYKQPSQHRTVVNCTNQNMTQLPKNLPNDKDITLILKGNQISQIQNMSYLDRVSVLDVSENNIYHVSESVASTLVSTSVEINLHGNPLHKLPSHFKTADPCAFNLGMLNMTCQCSDDWVGDWLVSRNKKGCEKNSSTTTNIYCIAPSHNVPVSQFNFKDLNCYNSFDYRSLSIGIAILLLLLSLLLTILYFFRYEIFLLSKRLRRARSHNGQFKYDVYISVHENNQRVILWIQQVLLLYLKSKGYNVFFRPIDETIGSVKEEVIIDNVRDSRNFILILSSDYIDENDENMDTIWTRIEWKHTWNCFKDESYLRNLIIINYDHLRKSTFPIGPFKAYLRLGLAIDFSNRKHKLLEEVRERLGLPNKHYSPEQLGFTSSKPKFSFKHYQQQFYPEITNTVVNAKKYEVEVDRLGFDAMSGYKAPALIHIDIS